MVELVLSMSCPSGSIGDLLIRFTTLNLGINKILVYDRIYISIKHVGTNQEVGRFLFVDRLNGGR